MKARCRLCMCLDYDFISDKADVRPDGEHVCGLHGCAPVDPDGEQVDFNHKGGCGFIAKHKEAAPTTGPIQLSLNFK